MEGKIKLKQKSVMGRKDTVERKSINCKYKLLKMTQQYLLKLTVHISRDRDSTPRTHTKTNDFLGPPKQYIYKAWNREACIRTIPSLTSQGHVSTPYFNRRLEVFSWERANLTGSVFGHTKHSKKVRVRYHIEKQKVTGKLTVVTTPLVLFLHLGLRKPTAGVNSLNRKLIDSFLRKPPSSNKKTNLFLREPCVLKA